jgi:hypothetical protein
MRNMPGTGLLSFADAAARLTRAYSPTTYEKLCQAVAAGTIPATRLGRQWTAETHDLPTIA